MQLSVNNLCLTIERVNNKGTNERMHELQLFFALSLITIKVRVLKGEEISLDL